MAEVLPTRILGLDPALGGGIPNKSLVLLTGETGSHYDTFAEQILYANAVNEGKSAYYLVESSPTDIIDNLEPYGFVVDEKILQNFTLISVQTPDLQELASLTATENRIMVSVTQSLAMLKKDFLNKAKEKRWTALQLSHLVFHYDFKEIVDLVLYMKAAVSVHGGLHFLLLPTGVHAEQSVNSVKHFADGVFEFAMRERTREFEGVMTVRKLRKIIHRPKTIPFAIGPQGLIVERAERIV